MNDQAVQTDDREMMGVRIFDAPRAGVEGMDESRAHCALVGAAQLHDHDR